MAYRIIYTKKIVATALAILLMQAMVFGTFVVSGIFASDAAVIVDSRYSLKKLTTLYNNSGISYSSLIANMRMVNRAKLLTTKTTTNEGVRVTTHKIVSLYRCNNATYIVPAVYQIKQNASMPY